MRFPGECAPAAALLLLFCFLRRKFGTRCFVQSGKGEEEERGNITRGVS